MTEALNRDFKIQGEIGRGRFGVVFEGTSCITGEPVAVKTIDKRSLNDDTLDSLCLLNEPKILNLLSPHPRITNLQALYEDDTYLHIVTELCPNQDLHSLITTSPTPLPESQAKHIFLQLMIAISHCHKNGIVHRDIKPDNILFDRWNNVKLADFGSAEIVKESVVGVVGTPYYVAPEVLLGQEYGEKVDVWSAGVVLYVMVAGFPPFYGESAVEIFEAVLRGNLRLPSRVFAGVSSALKDLLRKMITKDVSKRYTADQVLRHPFLTSDLDAALYI